MRMYELNPSDQCCRQTVLDSIDAHGGLYRTDPSGELLPDAAGNPVPIDYRVLPSRRFLVDCHGVLWRFFAEGAAKHPGAGGAAGPPWRSNRVEMWNGRWREITDAEGRVTYAKVLVARPLDKRINGHPGMSQIDWYRTVKKYRHPLDPPDAPAGAATDSERSSAHAAGQEHGRQDRRGSHSPASTDRAGERGSAKSPAKAARTNRKKG